MCGPTPGSSGTLRSISVSWDLDADRSPRGRLLRAAQTAVLALRRYREDHAGDRAAALAFATLLSLLPLMLLALAVLGARRIMLVHPPWFDAELGELEVLREMRRPCGDSLPGDGTTQRALPDLKHTFLGGPEQVCMMQQQHVRLERVRDDLDVRDAVAIVVRLGTAVEVLEVVLVLGVVRALVEVVLDAVAVAVADVRLEHDADERAEVRVRAGFGLEHQATPCTEREERVAREVELDARDRL